MSSFSFYPCTEWIYPDTEISKEKHSCSLRLAKNGHTAIQILTDINCTEKTPIKVNFNSNPLEITLSQLKPVCVDENSGRDLYTTLDWETVKDIAVRQAPYWVYDAVAELEDGILEPGRVALFLSVYADPSVTAGEYDINGIVTIGKTTLSLSLHTRVYDFLIPEVQDSRFGAINWLEEKRLAKAYHCEYGSEEFYKIADAYLTNMVELRCTHFMLPSGEPVRDSDGKVIDFDFTVAEKLGQIAVSHGFQHIYGGFLARFKVWTDPVHTLNWDRDIDCGSSEGYRQLRIYFAKWREIIKRNHWENIIMQALVDEPQEPNAYSYRALSAICRQLLPGITIIDPVETPNLLGALDIWVPKQDVYEKKKTEFQEIQSLGQDVWTYTCGFPTSTVMDRVLDKPLIISRLLMWQCFVYGIKGFLHYGYSWFVADDPFGTTCQDFSFTTPNSKLPPGGSFIVYPGEQYKVLSSMRWHMQRMGSEDVEMLIALSETDYEKAMELARKVSRSFYDYSTDSDLFEATRKAVMTALCSK